MRLTGAAGIDIVPVAAAINGISSAVGMDGVISGPCGHIVIARPGRVANVVEIGEQRAPSM